MKPFLPFMLKKKTKKRHHLTRRSRPIMNSYNIFRRYWKRKKKKKQRKMKKWIPKQRPCIQMFTSHERFLKAPQPLLESQAHFASFRNAVANAKWQGKQTSNSVGSTGDLGDVSYTVGFSESGLVTKFSWGGRLALPFTGDPPSSSICDFSDSSLSFNAPTSVRRREIWS